MPIFGAKKQKTLRENSEPLDPAVHLVEEPDSRDGQSSAYRSKIQFHCQLAHGSPTGIISDFATVGELYSKLASCYDIDAAEVMYIICYSLLILLIIAVDY